jgi:hypothetical protein
MRSAGALLVLSVLLCGVADAASYRFADLVWGSSPTEVRAGLVAKGYQDIAADKDGDLGFRGTVLETPVVGRALFAGAKLSAVTVILVTADKDCRSMYSRMKEVLTAKYGPPTQALEFFTSPYYKGDGFEDQAIRLGKGHFDVFWSTPPESRDTEGDDLWLGITDRLAVRIQYESPTWSEELKRRQAVDTDAF